MTVARDLFAELRSRGVSLRVVGDRLRYRPLQAVTPEIRARMAACRAELLALVERFEERAAIREYDGGLPRGEAERLAMEDVLGGGGRPVIPLRDHPPTDCPLCGRSTFWRARRAGSPWICGTCLPPTLEPREVEWLEDLHPTGALRPSRRIEDRPITSTTSVVLIRRIRRLPACLRRLGSEYWVDIAIGRSELRLVLVRRDPDGRRRLVLSPRRHPALGRIDAEVRQLLSSEASRAAIERAVLRELALEECL